MTTGEKEPWHLDKRIPVALILALFINTGGFIWWAAVLNERVAQLERTTARTGENDNRLVRLETQMETMNETLRETKDILRRMETHILERSRKP